MTKSLGVFVQKREHDGRYAYDGNLERVCVCGHTLGTHSAGSPPDCLFYSLPERERAKLLGHEKPNCGCERFRPSKRKESKRAH